MTNTNEDLGKRIEQMIAEHIAASRRTAQEAVEKAFASSAVAPAVGRSRPARAGARGKRRGAADLEALGERFYRAVCQNPGETMTVLAAEVCATARELHRAVARLKRTGRVRAVGQRSQTRYFPLAKDAAA
jgi:hypothetical protein